MPANMTQELHCKVQGTGPNLLLLHGMFGCAEDWTDLARLLETRYQLIIPDLPGFGGSRNLERVQDWGYDLITKLLLNQLDRLGVDKCSWLGYSLGGRLALYAASIVPERIDKLYLLGAGPGLEDPQERKDRLLLDTERAQRIINLGLEKFFDKWYRAELFSTLFANKELLHKVIERRLRHNSEAWASQMLVQLSPGKVPALWEALKNLTIPTKYVVGAHDKKYCAIADQVMRHNPKIMVEVIQTVGHSLHLECAEQLVELIT